MAGRPRTVSDIEILAGTARAVSRVGPARLTLAEVAREVGLSPATLVQRFGSKRALLLALTAHDASRVGKEFEDARAAGEPPLDTLMKVLCAMTRHMDTPEALSNSLAFLQMDLNEPDFHQYAIEQARSLRGEVEVLLDEAVDRGQLMRCDTARLARAVQVTFNGALVTWAIYREGTVAEWLTDDLRTLLAPLRPNASAGRSQGCREGGTAIDPSTADAGHTDGPPNAPVRPPPRPRRS
ncbi:MAG: TetR/AcrR family transcriptional regulator [Acidobacteria bacterium]|nr:TetR/AcrR family transcriptional regulator [Acidobacteriota bacterium]